MNKLDPSNSYGVNQLKRKAEDDLSNPSSKKARIADLATAAALEALAGAAPEPEELSQDKILDKLEKYPECYASVAFDYKESQDFNLEACSRNGLCLQYMDSFYQSKPHIVLAALKNNPRAIRFMSPYIHQGINIVIDVLKKDASLISLVPKKYFEHSFDVKLMLEITGVEGFKQAPETAKKDASLILSLIREGYTDLLKDLDPELKANGLFFRELLLENGHNKAILENAMEGYSDNEEFMLSIIDLSDEIADLSSDRLKGLKSFIVEALSMTDVSRFVKEPLLGDQDVLEELIRYKADVFKALPEDLQSDPSFAISMLVKNPAVLDQLSKSITVELKQREHVLELFEYLKAAMSEYEEPEEPQKSVALEVLGKRWFSQLDFMIEAIQIDPQNVIYATAAIKKNKDFIKKMAEISPSHLYLVDQSALDSLKFMKELIIINPDSIDYVPTSIWSEHKILSELLKIHPDLLYKFPDELRELKIFSK